MSRGTWPSGGGRRRAATRVFALLVWASVLGGYQAYLWRRGVTPLEAAEGLADSLAAGVAGALVFVAVYALSRFVLFPATLLTVAAGYVFGPVLGVALTVAGSNAAASVSYLLGRYFGEGLLDPGKGAGVAHRYAARMRENGFESVLLMYLVFAPLDAVGALAGFVRVGWRPFALATAVGLVPATLTWALLGASVGTDGLTGGPDGGLPRPEPWMLLASAALLAGSLALSAYLRRSRRRSGRGGRPAAPISDERAEEIGGGSW